MGWANCGKDSRGRSIGYAIDGICDHPGCEAEIDRGLAHACGGMHGEDTLSCERYFCGPHHRNIVEFDGQHLALCDECYADACEAAREYPDMFPEIFKTLVADENQPA